VAAGKIFRLRNLGNGPFAMEGGGTQKTAGPAHEKTAPFRKISEKHTKRNKVGKNSRKNNPSEIKIKQVNPFGGERFVPRGGAPSSEKTRQRRAKGKIVPGNRKKKKSFSGSRQDKKSAENVVNGIESKSEATTLWIPRKGGDQGDGCEAGK